MIGTSDGKQYESSFHMLAGWETSTAATMPPQGSQEPTGAIKSAMGSKVAPYVEDSYVSVPQHDRLKDLEQEMESRSNTTTNEMGHPLTSGPDDVIEQNMENNRNLYRPGPNNPSQEVSLAGKQYAMDESNRNRSLSDVGPGTRSGGGYSSSVPAVRQTQPLVEPASKPAATTEVSAATQAQTNKYLNLDKKYKYSTLPFHQYDMNDPEGKKIGQISVIEEPDNKRLNVRAIYTGSNFSEAMSPEKYVRNIPVSKGANTLTGPQMFDLKRELNKLYPEAEVAYGDRVTGFRTRKRGEDASLQVVPLKDDADVDKHRKEIIKSQNEADSQLRQLQALETPTSSRRSFEDYSAEEIMNIARDRNRLTTHQAIDTPWLGAEIEQAILDARIHLNRTRR